MWEYGTGRTDAGTYMGESYEERISKITDKTAASAFQTAYANKMAGAVDYISTISRAYSTGKAGATNFEDAFPMYDVITHVGNANISSGSWQRNDFPFWKYFDRNTSADALNDWKPEGANPSQMRSDLQKEDAGAGDGGKILQREVGKGGSEMSMPGVNAALIGAYPYVAAKNVNKADAGKISFAGRLQKTWETAESGAPSGTEQYVEHLKERYGANVMIKNVGNDQRSIDNFGASIAGYNNVVIAPNILEKMANDPAKAAYYESKIQSALNSFPRCQAELSAMGHEIYSYAVGVDENGVVHTYVTGDLKPEVRAKMEARVKAEQDYVYSGTGGYGFCGCGL